MAESGVTSPSAAGIRRPGEERAWHAILPPALADTAMAAAAHVREGRFQRSLSLAVAGASLMSGLEVSYEHYRGSYGQGIMWTPVGLSATLTGTALWGFFDPRAARTVLRWTSFAMLADCVVGFGFHIRGIARKPGGWRLPVANIIMGPPLFAPLLFGIAAYLGVIASYLQPEEAPAAAPRPLRSDWRADIHEGRFQKHVAVATCLSAGFIGFEALYSHYKNNFRYKAQWSPIVIAPALMVAAAASVISRRAARTWLPAMSLLAIADGGVGFFYHARGVIRRPGGLKKPLYNIMYGPPIFAPLLFAAAGTLGLLAWAMRRERR